MNILQDLEDIFCILHDGDIELIKTEENIFYFKANCEYLAELIKPDFKYFFLNLFDCHSVTFSTWHLDEPKKSILLKGVNKAFGNGIGILNGEIENDIIKVYSDIRYGDIDNDGGILKIAAKKYELFDQEKKPISLDELRALGKKYWDNFGS